MVDYSSVVHPSIEKLSVIRNAMAEDGINYLIITSMDPHLSEFISEYDKVLKIISGFTGTYAVMLVGMDECLLWTDSRYYIQAQIELSGSEIKLMKEGLEGVDDIYKVVLQYAKEDITFAVDYSTIGIKAFEKLKKCAKNASFVDAKGILSLAKDKYASRHFGPVEYLNSDFFGKSSFEKISEIRRYITEKYNKDLADYIYVVSNLESIMWILNLRGSDIRYVPVAYSYLIITDTDVTLYISDDADLLKSHLTDINIYEYDSFYEDCNKYEGVTVFMDKSTNNARILKSLSLKNDVKFVDDNFLIRKYIKTPSEIQGMKKAHIKDAVLMIRFIKRLKEMAEAGELTDEYSISMMLDKMRFDMGCSDMSFETICAYGKNAAIVHYEANEDVSAQIFSKGMLLVDSGGQYPNLGTTDITRTIVLGEVSQKEKEAYTAVLIGNLRLLNLKFPKGFYGYNIDIVAKKPIWDVGYDYGHGTGHGIGAYLSVHESPVRISYRVGSKDDYIPPFEEGMILSDEPGIYVENEFGVRLENAVLIKNVEYKGQHMLGFESLTLVPFDKEAIDYSLMNEEDLDNLRRYNQIIVDNLKDYLNKEEMDFLIKEVGFWHIGQKSR